MGKNIFEIIPGDVIKPGVQDVFLRKGCGHVTVLPVIYLSF